MPNLPSVQEIVLANVPYNETLAGTTARPSLEDPLKDGQQTPTEDKVLTLVDQTLFLPAARVALIVVSLTLSFAVGVLEQTIVAVALPKIASSFSAGKQVSWVVSSFLIGSAAASPLFGRICDIWSRKTIQLASVAILFCSTIGCAWSQTIYQLMVFRAFQGVGVAGATTCSTIVLGDIVPLRERGRYQGIVETICVSCQVIGPLLGAALTQALGWRSAFYILLPMIALAGVLQFFLIPAKKMTGSWRLKLRSLDWLGCFFSLSTILLLTVAITRAGVETAWSSAATLSCFIFAGLSCAAFIFWEQKGAELPILPMRLFRITTVSALLFTTFTSMAANFIILFYIPQYLQVVRGFPIIKAGLAVVPYGGCLSMCVFVATWSARYVSMRTIIITGFILWTMFTGLLLRFNEDTAFQEIIGIMTIGGIGGGLALVLPIMALQAAVPRADMAVVTSTRNSARLTGGAVGTAAAAAIVGGDIKTRLLGLGLSNDLISKIVDDPESLQHVLKDTLDAHVLSAIVREYVKTYRLVFWLVFGLAAFSLLVSVIGIRHVALEKDDDEAQKEAAKAWLAEQQGQKATVIREKDAGLDVEKA